MRFKREKRRKGLRTGNPERAERLFVRWPLAMTAGLVLVCMGNSTSITADDRQQQVLGNSVCGCRGATECVDIGDSEWIVVEGRSTAGNSLLKARREAALTAKRQLLWCIQAMPFKNGECLFNQIKDQRELEKKFDVLIEKRSVSEVHESPDGEIRIILKLSRKEVLRVFGLGDGTEKEEPAEIPKKE
jgi:hypothetical protein